MWLDKRLKSSVLEDPSTGNMVRETKHYGNMSHTTFITFID